MSGYGAAIVNFSNVGTLIGGDQNDTFVYAQGASENGVDGGGGNTTLDATTTVYNASASTPRFQHLVANGGNDQFVLDNGMGVAGTIDGGIGISSLNYSAYTTAVTVNLGSTGAATTGIGGGILNIQNVIGPTSTTNTLLGPDQAAATWEITGRNLGMIDQVTYNATLTLSVPVTVPVSFSGFANLTGAADTNDGFIVRAGGSISGTMNGGAGGDDNLAIENPASPGQLAILEPDATGGGTLQANQVFPNASQTTFAGLEQPLQATTSAAGVTLQGTDFNDHLTLSQNAGTQELTLADANSFWDYSAAALAAGIR
ncbi:MAG TPA: hypothetical protein VNH11_03275 [Pirellulales bacterium]|nr:hypothetical protein [Pirellulales bacterium]